MNGLTEPSYDCEAAYKQLQLDYQERLQVLDEFLQAEAGFITDGRKVSIPVDDWDDWMDKLSNIESAPLDEERKRERSLINVFWGFFYKIREQADPDVIARIHQELVNKMSNIQQRHNQATGLTYGQRKKYRNGARVVENPGTERSGGADNGHDASGFEEPSSRP